MVRTAVRAVKAHRTGPDAGQGHIVREQLKVDRPLSLRAPTNEIAHRVAKSQREIGLPARAVLAGWASSPGASRQAGGMSHPLQADCVTASAFIARWPSAAWPVFTSASWLL